VKQLKNEVAQLGIFLKHDKSHNFKNFEQVGYKTMLERFDRDFKFEQKKVLMRHNLHNKIIDELKKKKLEYQEEVNGKKAHTCCNNNIFSGFLR
jgi:hypothetical protein